MNSVPEHNEDNVKKNGGKGVSILQHSNKIYSGNDANEGVRYFNLVINIHLSIIYYVSLANINICVYIDILHDYELKIQVANENKFQNSLHFKSNSKFSIRINSRTLGNFFSHSLLMKIYYPNFGFAAKRIP